VLSNGWTWKAVALLVFLIALLRRDISLFKTLLYCSVALGLSDALCAYVLKPFLAQSRPCYGSIPVRLVAEGCGSVFGLPSNHAANGMAVTVMIWKRLKSPWPAIVLGNTLLVGLSRIYLGVHYPSQIIFGFLVGGCIGYFLWKASLLIFSKPCRTPG